MIDIVKRLTGKTTKKGAVSKQPSGRKHKKKQNLPPKDYGQQADDARSDNVEKRLNLALSSETHKEVLYYLAEKDPEPAVRRAVIDNDALPMQVSPILAQDSDIDVRLALAGRLVDLLPDVSRDEQSQIYAFTVQALGTLALDEVLKIRVALSSTLKDHAHTPPKIAGQLARDVEREVSEPILRFCAAVADEDLLDILKGHPAPWVIDAIAARREVSEGVSLAVIETEERPAGSTLIKNDGAALVESVLHQIVLRARDFPEWQKPISERAHLPLSIAKQLAEFVDESVRELLLGRGDFSTQEIAEIGAVFRRRVDFATEEEADEEPLEKRLHRLYKENRLNDETIADALGMRDREFVMGALAYLTKSTIQTIKAIFRTQSAKSITAVTWKAGLSMRLALQLQQDIGQVSHKKLIYPKGGTDYPLTDDDLQWQVEFLGL